MSIPRHLLSAVLAGGLVLNAVGMDQVRARDSDKHITAELNSKRSDQVKRLQLVQTAGTDSDTGAYFVKIYLVTRGEECDVDGGLCEGRDLLISVASLDLFGDHALFRVTGIQDWRFVKWTSFAGFDAPEYFTSFQAEIRMRPGQILKECRNAGAPAKTPPASRPGEARLVSFQVSPWKLACEYQ